MKVFDFCEWLRIKVVAEEQLDISELAYNEEYNSIFQEYAEEYFSNNVDLTQDTGLDIKTSACFLIDHIREFIDARYFDHKIPYRCLILSLKQGMEGYKQFIEEWRDDLHAMSGNLLDILYYKIDDSKSGYKLITKIKCISQNLRGRLPCILLWQDNITKAKIIDINRLEKDEIFEVISKIVESINLNIPFEVIVKEAERVSAKCIERKGAITTNILHIGGDNNGVASAANFGTIEMAVINDFDIAQFSSEAENAIAEINDSTEIGEQQKLTLIGIINEAQEAIKANSREGQEKSKTRFKDVVCFMGNIAPKLISSLSGLATIAKFFGM